MSSKDHTRLTGLVLVCVLGVSACGSATTTTASPKATTSTTAGAPPGGSGEGGGNAAQVAAKGAHVHSTGTTSASGKMYSASAANTSGVMNAGGSLTLDEARMNTGGWLTLDEARISTSGASSSSDQSSFYGLDAGILAKAGSITMNAGSTATTGDGANDVFATAAAP